MRYTKDQAEGVGQTASRGVQALRGVARGCRLIMWSLLDFVYPAQCCICGAVLGEQEATVCGACWSKIPVIGQAHCIRCGASAKGLTDGCSNCLTGDLRFQYARILAPFNDLVREIIHQLKYNQKRSLGLRLGGELGNALQDDCRFRHVDIVLPVPLHKVRLKERGFNQSELLARALGQTLGKAVLPELLVRARHTNDQTRLGPQERRANVAGAFKVADPARMVGRHIGLVDDVITTGATMDACSEAVLAAGARSVFVVAAARPFADQAGNT